MIKIIRLGTEFPSTGEARVRILNTNLVKTASSHIQAFWDTLSESQDYSYLWVIGVSAFEYYGCNNNGDAFKEAELKAHHPSFIENAHIFLHHVNKDPKKSIGKPVYSFYNDIMHRVELILRIDKSIPSAASIVQKLKNGELISVSMGCRVKFDVCSICGNQAKTRNEYCDHAKYNMKTILPDGRQVMVFNPEPKFFDISIVNKPADPSALTLDKIASENNSPIPPMYLSAKLGEDSEMYTKKIAALDKFSDIIKKIDGYPTKIKDGDAEIDILKKIDPSKLDYPVLGFDELNTIDTHPGCILRAITDHGAPPSLGEMAYSYGKYNFGNDFSKELAIQIFNLIPYAIRLLRGGGAPLENIAYPIIQDSIPNSIPAELNSLVKPVASSRVLIIKQAADEAQLNKFASDLINELEMQALTSDTAPKSSFSNIYESIHPSVDLRSTLGPGHYEQLTVTDSEGNNFNTDLRSVNIATEQNTSSRATRKLLGAALGAAALGALFTEPDLVKKLLTASGLGAGALSLWDTEPASKIITNEGVEVPANTLFMQKKAAASFVRNNAGALIGMSIPAALGMDYLINSRGKYKHVRDPENYMTKGQRARYTSGKVVADAPVLTSVLGGLGGAAGAESIRRIADGFRKVK